MKVYATIRSSAVVALVAWTMVACGGSPQPTPAGPALETKYDVPSVKALVTSSAVEVDLQATKQCRAPNSSWQSCGVEPSALHRVTLQIGSRTFPKRTDEQGKVVFVLQELALTDSEIDNSARVVLGDPASPEATPTEVNLRTTDLYKAADQRTSAERNAREERNKAESAEKKKEARLKKNAEAISAWAEQVRSLTEPVTSAKVRHAREIRGTFGRLPEELSPSAIAMRDASKAQLEKFVTLVEPFRKKLQTIQDRAMKSAAEVAVTTAAREDKANYPRPPMTRILTWQHFEFCDDGFMVGLVSLPTGKKGGSASYCVDFDPTTMKKPQTGPAERCDWGNDGPKSDTPIGQRFKKARERAECGGVPEAM